MANEAQVAREAVVVAVGPSPGEAIMARLAAVVGHHFPEALTEARVAQVCVVVAISRPHGWGIFDDPPL